MMNTEQIRRNLRNIKTRAATINAAAETGSAIVDDILPLLQDRNDGVRWSVIKILSEVGDHRAIGALITLLEQGKNTTDAANALRAITEQDFGDAPEAWKNWVMQDVDIRNTIGTGILSDKDLIMEATRGLPATVSGEGQEFCVQMSLPEKRSQQVWIDFSKKDPLGRPLVQLITPCGNADPERYEEALKLNMVIPFGALAIASLDDKDCFAIVDAYLRATAHPEVIADSIVSLAHHGDAVEQSLSQEDRF